MFSAVQLKLDTRFLITRECLEILFESLMNGRVLFASNSRSVTYLVETDYFTNLHMNLLMSPGRRKIAQDWIAETCIISP